LTKDLTFRYQSASSAT